MNGRPDPKRMQLEHEYSTALRDCVTGAGEVALTHAYELGRMAAGTGIGVVELAAIHDHALREVLGEKAPPSEVDQFFAEALSPFLDTQWLIDMPAASVYSRVVSSDGALACVGWADIPANHGAALADPAAHAAILSFLNGGEPDQLAAAPPDAPRP